MLAKIRKSLYQSLAIVATLSLSAELYAGAREQAKRMHDRITGVPPTAAVLDNMANLITAGNPTAAANLALEDSNFYTVTLKNWVTPWTNEAQTVFAPLNDYTATVIGMIRDDVDFRQVLSGDILYTGGSGFPAYANGNNDHYAAMENQGADLKAVLTATTQSSTTGLATTATAGVTTTRAAAKAFFIAGTNRAMFRFTLMNHLCTDLEALKDNTRSPERIRQDVTRSPGGDSRIFLNNCVSCHAGMDPLAQAYAYYEYQYDADNDPTGENGAMTYNSVGMTDPETGTRVQAKYHINDDVFKFGFITEDDQWDNFWRNGPNANLGWAQSLPGSGNGAKSMGEELANSEAFAQCQVKKVFKAMCLRQPGDQADRDQVSSMVSSFKNNSYRLKSVFADAAVYCMGD